MNCCLGEMIAYSYHEETNRHLVSCYASVGSEASVMLVLCSPSDKGVDNRARQLKYP
jgi:hypothetical protein